jgi:predicted GNAT family acetyltransferase
MLGPAGQVAAVRQALEAAHGAALELDEILVQMDEVENLYSLDLAELRVPEGLRAGRWQARRIEARDLELIVAWRVAFGLESLGEVDSPDLWERYRATVERAFEEGCIWLLEDGGRPMSTSGFNAAIAEAVQIGGVYTPPELRSRGYGRAVVAASLLDARAEGVSKAILFTGVDNVAAQKAYLGLGFQHIGDYRILLLRFPVDAGV